MDVLSVESVLQELNDVLADGVLALEALRMTTLVSKLVPRSNARKDAPWSS